MILGIEVRKRLLARIDLQGGPADRKHAAEWAVNVVTPEVLRILEEERTKWEREALEKRG